MITQLLQHTRVVGYCNLYEKVSNEHFQHLNIMEDEPGSVSIFGVVGSCLASNSYSTQLRVCFNTLVSLDSKTNHRLIEGFSSCPNDYLDRLIRWAKAADLLRGYRVLCSIGARPWDPTFLYFENATVNDVAPEIFQTNSTPPSSIDSARASCFKVEAELSKSISDVILRRITYPVLHEGYYAFFIEGKLVRFGQLSSRYRETTTEAILKWDGKVLYSPNCGSHERFYLNHVNVCSCDHCTYIAIAERFQVLEVPDLPFSTVKIAKALDSVLRFGRDRRQPSVIVNVARAMHKYRIQEAMNLKNYPNKLTEVEVYALVVDTEDVQSQPEFYTAVGVAYNNLAYLLANEKAELPKSMQSRSPPWTPQSLLEAALKFSPDLWEARYNLDRLAVDSSARDPWMYK
jgi:hypothetical protein